MNWSFDETTHTYTSGGARAPSVTQVISDSLPYRGPVAGNAWYMQRGSAVHACAAMIARGEEFEIADPDADNRAYMEGCCAGIRRFFAEVKPVVIAVEQRMFSSRYRYGGTLDLLAEIDGGATVLDWKPSAAVGVPYQLGGYSILYGEHTGKKYPRWGRGLYYSPDGTYSLGKERYDLRHYGTAFLALLGAWSIREKEGYHNDN